MKTKYKLKLEEGIKQLIDDDEFINDMERGWINKSLVQRMVDAAEAVYDNTMEFQRWALEENIMES